MTCHNCYSANARRKGLCDACYQYRWRKKVDRPEGTILKHNIRVLDNELATRRLRRASLD